ncbi:hypothetical protein ACFVWX_23220 [Streptomyces sp. NPDC058220]|uniref:hypothetical protein n=1 Tax=unclassified Streptomyces TaxID=2593676 RepID=UPI00365C25AB
MTGGVSDELVMVGLMEAHRSDASEPGYRFHDLVRVRSSVSYGDFTALTMM